MVWCFYICRIIAQVTHFYWDCIICTSETKLYKWLSSPLWYISLSSSHKLYYITDFFIVLIYLVLNMLHPSVDFLCLSAAKQPQKGNILLWQAGRSRSRVRFRAHTYACSEKMYHIKRLKVLQQKKSVGVP